MSLYSESAFFIKTYSAALWLGRVKTQDRHRLQFGSHRILFLIYLFEFTQNTQYQIPYRKGPQAPKLSKGEAN